MAFAGLFLDVLSKKKITGKLQTIKRMTYFCYQENDKCSCYLYAIASVLIRIATSVIMKNKKNDVAVVVISSCY